MAAKVSRLGAFHLLLLLCLVFRPGRLATGPTARAGQERGGSHERWPPPEVRRRPVVWKAEVGEGGRRLVGRKVVLHTRAGEEERLECFAAHTGKLLRHAYPTSS